MVRAGHKVVGKKDGEALKGKCDSTVTETDVRFPTDISVLFDAVRTAIRLIAVLCSVLGLTAWRLHHKNIQTLKKLLRTVQNLVKSIRNLKNDKVRAEAMRDSLRIHD